MAKPGEAITTVSSKGQIVLPKEVRERRKWPAGTRLSVRETDEGVLLKQAPIFPRTRADDVFGSLGHAGAPKSVEDMAAGIAAEAKRRHARNRY